MFRTVGLCALLALLSAPMLASEHFKDVPRDHWATEAVDKLAEMGVVNGYPDGTFRGDRPVTRYELATVLVRFIEYIRESQKPLADAGKLDRPTPTPGGVISEKSAQADVRLLAKQTGDPIAFLKVGGFLTEDSVLLQKDTGKSVTVDQLAQSLATVAAKLIEERIPAPQ